MKNLISLLTILALGTAFYAQAPKESKVRIIMDKDDNGVVTKMDTTIQLDNPADIQDILKQYGVDANINIDSDMKGSEAKVMRFEMNIETDGDASDVDVNQWISDDGEIKVEIDGTKDVKVFDGNLKDMIENLEGLDNASREEVQQLLKKMEMMDGEHKDVKILRFESHEDSDSDEGKPRVMMFKSDKGAVNLEEIDVDDVVSVDVRKFKDADGNGVKMIREIRVVIKLEDLDEDDKVALKRAGAPVAPSIAESLQLDDLVFYPNPNDGRFRLRFNAPNKGDVNVRVVNMDGKTLYSEDLLGFSGSYDEVISIENQSAGAYLLSISQNGQTVNKKLVKQ